MTNQELFDECVGHVLRQGRPGADHPSGYLGCMYKTPQGNCCTVGGPLVKRGLYREEMEFNSVSEVLFETADLTMGENLLRDALTAWGVKPNQIPLLKDIQRSHDAAAKMTGHDTDDVIFIAAFKDKAHRVAIAHELNALVFDTFNAGEPAC